MLTNIKSYNNKIKCLSCQHDMRLNWSKYSHFDHQKHICLNHINVDAKNMSQAFSYRLSANEVIYSYQFLSKIDYYHDDFIIFTTDFQSIDMSNPENFNKFILRLKSLAFYS